MTVNVVGVVVMFPLMLIFSKKPIQTIRKQFKHIAPIGLFSGFSLMFQMLAVSLTLVVYAISIKRLSILFSVIWGALILKEKVGRVKFLATALLILGIFLIYAS